MCGIRPTSSTSLSNVTTAGGASQLASSGGIAKRWRSDGELVLSARNRRFGGVFASVNPICTWSVTALPFGV
jgi:hypothetical protein